MNCPFLQDKYSYDCKKENCGLWCKKTNQCSLASMAESMYIMTKFERETDEE